MLFAEIDGVASRSIEKRTHESLLVAPAFVADFAAVASKGSVIVENWPVAPGDRHRVRFERVDVYAPGAMVWVDDGRLIREIPRSKRIRLVGRSLDNSSIEVFVSIHPGRRTIRGLSTHPGRESYTIDEPSKENMTLHSLSKERETAPGSGEPLRYGCGFDELPWREEIDDELFQAAPGRAANKTSSLRQIVVAVDTDNEFNHKKFGNNTSEAEDWIVDLFALMTALYERDLSLRILKGDTIYRLDTDASPTYDDDPYSLTGSPVSSAQLGEFGSYWSANMSGVDRAFAMLLSGKSAYDSSSSGRAWLDGYCEKQSTGGGYSVSQVFLASWVSITNDLRVIAHELGHESGFAAHPLLQPSVDNCYACESGCFSGTVSCPGGGTGTLMSYCHFATNPASCGANCGGNQAALHSTVGSLMDGYVTSHTPSCVELVYQNAFFTDSFEVGNSSNWTGTVP